MVSSKPVILITGGNGNLGRLVADRFEALGWEVASFDLPGSETADCAARKAVIAGDVRDTDLLGDVIDAHAPRAVMHLASLLSGSSEADPALAWDVNASASVRLMQLARERVAGPFVFASTIASYGPGLPAHLPEDAPQWPANVYGATKVAVERVGHWLKERGGFDFRCIRFPMVLSPFAPPGAVTAYPSHAFRAAARGEAFTFPVSAETGMSTMFLDDVTRSLVELTLADPVRLRRPAYNMHGFHFTAGQLVERLQARHPKARFDFAPDAGVDATIAAWPDTIDDRGARMDWDWRPEYDFTACVTRMFEITAAGSS